MATTTIEFDYTGAAQSWTVPANVTTCTVELQGGATSMINTADNTMRYSTGGHVVGTLTTVPGQVYYIYVGEDLTDLHGNNKALYEYQGTGGQPGGWNGGGAGGAGYAGTSLSPGTANLYAGGGGAGRTSINGPNANAKANVKAMAGGAGGPGAYSYATNNAGGQAGATNGSNGDSNLDSEGGKGGTQTASGAGGTGTGWRTGGAGATSGAGGAGAYATSTDNTKLGTNYGGGGGGGGWFGGGGGAAAATQEGVIDGGNTGGGGGGGSNYVGGLATVTTNASGTITAAGTTQGTVVRISYNANASDPANVPTSVVPVNGAATKSTGSLAVSALYSDPNKDTGYSVFRYSIDPNFSTYTDYHASTVAAGVVSGTSSGTITGLAVNTQYFLRVYNYNISNANYSTSYAASMFYTDRIPNVPTNLTPVAATSFLTNTTATASAQVTDPDGGTCYAVFQVTTDSTFATGISTTNGTSVSSGQTSVATISGLTAATHYYIRAYTNDGSGGVSVAANGPTSNFWTNRPPNAPTLVTPINDASVDYTKVIAFAWNFSDADPNDSQGSADIQYRVVGVTPWTTATGIATTSNAWNAPASTFVGGQYEYQIRTYDTANSVSPWSSSGFFVTAGTPANATITAPTSQQVEVSTPITVTWTTPVSQVAYNLSILGDTSGSPDPGKAVYLSGWVTAGTQTVTVPVTNEYNIQWVVLQYQQFAGVSSAAVQVQYRVEVPYPQPPQLTSTVNNTNAVVGLFMATPLNGIAATALRVYRDPQDGSGPVEVYSGPPLTTWNDYFAPIGVNCKYTIEQDSVYGGTSSEEMFSADLVQIGTPSNGASYYFVDGNAANDHATFALGTDVTFGNYIQVNTVTTGIEIDVELYPNPGGPMLPGYNFNDPLALPVVAGETYNFSFMSKAASTGVYIYCTIFWLSAAGTQVSYSQLPATVHNTTSWTQMPALTAKAPPTAVVAHCLIWFNHQDVIAGQTHYLGMFSFNRATVNGEKL